MGAIADSLVVDGAGARTLRGQVTLPERKLFLLACFKRNPRGVNARGINDQVWKGQTTHGSVMTAVSKLRGDVAALGLRIVCEDGLYRLEDEPAGGVVATPAGGPKPRIDPPQVSAPAPARDDGPLQPAPAASATVQITAKISNAPPPTLDKIEPPSRILPPPREPVVLARGESFTLDLPPDVAAWLRASAEKNRKTPAQIGAFLIEAFHAVATQSRAARIAERRAS